MEIYAYGITFASCHQMTLKKSVIGNGHAKKKEVIKFILEFHNKQVTDDEADAIMLIHHYHNIGK